MEFYNAKELNTDSNEVIILASIAEVKLELQHLRTHGTKEQQLECFKRLINLFSALNIEKLLQDQKNLV